MSLALNLCLLEYPIFCISSPNSLKIPNPRLCSLIKKLPNLTVSLPLINGIFLTSSFLLFNIDKDTPLSLIVNLPILISPLMVTLGILSLLLFILNI